MTLPAPQDASPAPAPNPALVAAIRAEIASAGGRIPFARFMELALYHPAWGYYRSPARRPGRPGDFLTAPEAHPFFGITLARQIAECWERLGRPDPFDVREYGSGIGALAWDVIAGLSREAPACRAALRYRLVEQNPHRLAEALAVFAAEGLGDVVVGEDAGEGSLEPIVGVLLANEVADAFGVHRLIWHDGQLREGWVVWQGDGFAEEEGDLSPEAAAARPEAMLRQHGIALREGDRIEISPAAAAWFAAAARGLARGYAIVIDYGYPAPELYRQHRLEGTVRAYRAHTVSDDPFSHVGETDLTAHVDFSALREAGEREGLRFAGQTNQGAFLASLGMGELLVALGQDPETTMPEYLAAQAAILRLIDPGGMGRFGVLVMVRDAPISPPLRGFSVAPPAF
ncbi:MAG: SAM-dependent methyltransferase [Thermomicrobiales bacterium]|nr:SAM-dependent methyltransferase [Thermomicrobiales bacterium]